MVDEQCCPSCGRSLSEGEHLVFLSGQTVCSACAEHWSPVHSPTAASEEQAPANPTGDIEQSESTQAQSTADLFQTTSESIGYPPANPVAPVDASGAWLGQSSVRPQGRTLRAKKPLKKSGGSKIAVYVLANGLVLAAGL